MENLILIDLDKRNLSNEKIVMTYKEIIELFPKENSDILIIFNKPYLKCKEFLEENNIYYNYLLSNNTVFSKNGDIVYTNHLKSFNVELFLSEISRSLATSNVKFYDEYGLTNNIGNLVKVSIKNGIFSELENILSKLNKTNLSITKSNGWININPSNTFSNCIEFLLKNNDYKKIYLSSKNKAYDKNVKQYNTELQSIACSKKGKILKKIIKE